MHVTSYIIGVASCLFLLLHKSELRAQLSFIMLVFCFTFVFRRECFPELRLWSHWTGLQRRYCSHLQHYYNCRWISWRAPYLVTHRKITLIFTKKKIVNSWSLIKVTLTIGSRNILKLELHFITSLYYSNKSLVWT